MHYLVKIGPEFVGSVLMHISSVQNDVKYHASTPKWIFNRASSENGINGI